MAVARRVAGVVASAGVAAAAALALCRVAPRDHVPKINAAPGQARHRHIAHDVQGCRGAVAVARMLHVLRVALRLFLVLPRLLAYGQTVSIVASRMREMEWRTELPLCNAVLDTSPLLRVGNGGPVSIFDSSL